MYNSEKNSEIQSRRWRMAHEYGKETLSKEFKSDRDKGLPDSELVEAVVALANTDGGCVYLGVEDDGTATGEPGSDLIRIHRYAFGRTVHFHHAPQDSPRLS